MATQNIARASSLFGITHGPVLASSSLFTARSTSNRQVYTGLQCAYQMLSVCRDSHPRSSHCWSAAPRSPSEACCILHWCRCPLFLVRCAVAQGTCMCKHSAPTDHDCLLLPAVCMRVRWCGPRTARSWPCSRPKA